MSEDRIYVIPLRGAKKFSRSKRAPRALKEVRSFLERHLKTSLFAIDESVNNKIWENGIENIPSKIRVRVTEEEEIEEGQAAFRVFLAE